MSQNNSRRDFLKLLGAGTASIGAMIGGRSAFAGAQPHVVVIGGGVGGATFAKYLRMYDPNVKVTIVERNKQYQRPYGSSEVITGQATVQDITISYDDLKNRHGVDFVFDTVTGIDYDKHEVRTLGGATLKYDRLVVSPGISFDYSKIEGLDAQVADTKIPHGWATGPQLLLLKKQLESLPKNGTVIVGPPPNPYRCPPGPYERAGLIAQWLINRGDTGAKVIILDPKNGFTTDFSMLQAWNRLYGFNIPKPAQGKYSAEQLATMTEHKTPGKIEWVMGDLGGRILKVDPSTNTVEAEAGSFQADMINIIPPLKAGKLALEQGLADESGWCPVDQKTFESTLHPDVHVIGDACIAGAMPKSGYAANSQAKVVALQVKALLAGQGPMEPVYQNTCYALAGNTEYGMFVADVFRLKNGRITRMDQQRYLPFNANEAQHRLAAIYQHAWMNSFTDDCFT